MHMKNLRYSKAAEVMQLNSEGIDYEYSAVAMRHALARAAGLDHWRR